MLPRDAAIGITNCDREPIHIPGGIQDIGFLVALSADWLVQRAANTEKFLGIAPEDMLGKSLPDVFAKQAVDLVRDRISMLRGKDSVERLFAVPLLEDGSLFDLALHFSGRSVVLEAERSKGDQVEVSSTTRNILGRLAASRDVDTLLNECARQARALLGFDRVMIYRFAADESGEVVAQSVARGFESFLGLNFPSTDIPQQARKLYVRNTFRIIGDATAEQVPIVQRGEGEPLDLSLALYRAVSPIHLEYLRNMGVAASLSISIIVNGKLWGLIACHHHQPHMPSFAERSAAELFGQIFSLQLESRINAESTDYESKARHVGNRVMTAAAQDPTKLLDAEWLLQMMDDAIECDGIMVHMEGEMSSAGIHPNEGIFQRLVDTLNTREAQIIHHSHNLSTYLGGEELDTPAAGFLAIPISRRPRDYMVLFREEQLRSVRWAGEQAKHVTQTEDGLELTPRKSFEAWKQTVTGQSKPFNLSEVRVATSLRSTLLEIVLRLSEAASEDRRKATEQQKLLIAELNHRVRNILALIRALMSQTKREEGSISDVVDTLESRVKALATAHDMLTAENWAPTPLRTLFEVELQAYMSPTKQRVTMDGPDVSILPEAIPIMALVIHELATNAAKYGALSDSGTIALDWHCDDDKNLVLNWREKGGPAVQKPERQGFGTTIINNSIPHELGGESAIEYKTSGIEACFTVPAKHVVVIEDEQVETASAEKPDVRSIPLGKERMLLVEDSMLIALDAEDQLRDMGVGEVVLAASNNAALRALDEGITIAMLDFNLGDETSLPIAEKLREKGVPFFFASGYGAGDVLPAEFADVHVITKPYSRDQIEQAIAQIRG
ncbi:HWE histidine kinase domain-containing protein [Alteriqipengyuania sp. WL0013]|uniref:HWE histidine kinase domain-containing protein n=1 Tax=Alteriqipengyuania sp. WL0013 TaxID=3110773 RepID=UPI002BCFDED5|nr:HWE histidine kinase domain-containing protein [Alteriqipengyuania sp. WL0013]MEB3416532.1 HWE histidine kinase domain-containing protein [Alteriqipengyuania sp. WL0013]